MMSSLQSTIKVLADEEYLVVLEMYSEKGSCCLLLKLAKCKLERTKEIPEFGNFTLLYSITTKAHRIPV